MASLAPSLLDRIMVSLSQGTHPGAAFGTQSSVEEAERPRNGLDDFVTNSLNSVAGLPKRAFKASEDLRTTGDHYNPAPVMEAALTAMTGGMPFAEAGAAGIFGGKLAITGDARALAQAEKMAARGADRDKIFRDTGWFQGADGQWRFEISDARAKLKAPDPNAAPTIGAVLDHPALYKNYPSTQDIPLYGVKSKGTFGEFDPSGGNWGSIGLNTTDNPNALNTLLHELQHSIQAKEGFSSGTSPSAAGSFDKYRRNAGEVESRNVETRRDLHEMRAPGDVVSGHIGGVSFSGTALEADALKAARAEGIPAPYAAEMLQNAKSRRVPPWATEDVPRAEQLLNDGTLAMSSGPKRLRSDMADAIRNRKPDADAWVNDDSVVERLIAERQAMLKASTAKRQTELDGDIAAGRVPKGSDKTFAEIQEDLAKAAAQRAEGAAWSERYSAPVDTRAPQRLQSGVMDLYRRRLQGLE